MASDKRKKASGMADGKNTDCGSMVPPWTEKDCDRCCARWHFTRSEPKPEPEEYVCTECAAYERGYNEGVKHTESGSAADRIAEIKAESDARHESAMRELEDIRRNRIALRDMECRSVFSGDDLRRILEWHEEVRSTCGISADDDNLRKRIVGALRTTEQESVTDRLRGLLRRMLAQGYHSAADMLEREIQAMDCGSVDGGGEG